MRQAMELQEMEDKRSRDRMTELMTTAATAKSEVQQKGERMKVHEEQNLQLQRALVVARKHGEKTEAELARAKSFLHRKESEMTGECCPAHSSRVFSTPHSSHTCPLLLSPAIFFTQRCSE
jgi:hypothetical protein